MHLKETLCHVGGIREHLAVGDDHLESGDNLRCGVRDRVLNLFNACCRLCIPVPHIVKRFDLWLDRESAPSEDGVVFLVGVERRIEADKVNASGGEVRHDVQAVAVVKNLGVWCKSDVHLSFSSSSLFISPTKVGGWQTYYAVCFVVPPKLVSRVYQMGEK